MSEPTLIDSKTEQLSIEEAFGSVLRCYRKKAQLTQQSLSDKSGLSLNFISYCERGKQQPSINSLFLLSLALDTQPAELISALQEMNPRPNF